MSKRQRQAFLTIPQSLESEGPNHLLQPHNNSVSLKLSENINFDRLMQKQRCLEIDHWNNEFED
jgi:hypothetical protein